MFWLQGISKILISFPLVLSPNTLSYVQGVIRMVDVFYTVWNLLHISYWEAATVMVTLLSGGCLQD